MNEYAASPPPLFAQKWAVRLGAALLAALALVLVLTLADKLRLTRLETPGETTGVGDGKFFQPPATLPAVVASYQTREIVVSALEKIEIRDTHVRRVAVDVESGLAIYELSAAATEEERARAGKHAGDVFLKMAPGEYVGARTTPR